MEARKETLRIAEVFPNSPNFIPLYFIAVIFVLVALPYLRSKLDGETMKLFHYSFKKTTVLPTTNFFVVCFIDVFAF